MLEGRPIDVLHIVAGILPDEDRPIWEWGGEDILRVLNTNAIGAVRLATHATVASPRSAAATPAAPAVPAAGRPDPPSMTP